MEDKYKIKTQLYTLTKMPIKTLIKQNFDVNLSKEDQISNFYLIKQGSSLFFDQIERLRGKYSEYISEVVLIVAKKNPNAEKHLKHILDEGFDFNGTHYIRFGKSSSQGKDGITAFVSEDIYDELYLITQMDIPIDECVISKYEAQRNLVFSNCTIVKNYFPRIVIIDEYEKTLKDQWIRYVVETFKEYTDKETGHIKKYKTREIKEGYYDIHLSPFDGCGCNEIEYMEHVSEALGLDYNVIGTQVRIPFMKGFSVYVPFREIFKEMGITHITDVYGKSHNVNDIDCIWNTSMFKGHGIFKNKYGDNAWLEYMNTIKKYDFKLGISKYSHHIKDLNLKSRANYQYLQCLDLWNPKYINNYQTKPREPYDILAEENEGKIISLAKYSTNLFEKIIKGDEFYTYKFLGINDNNDYDSDIKYLEAAMINDTMLHDMAIKQYLHRKLKKQINQLKLGKIYLDGFYHTLVGDMIGYLEYAAGLDPIGCLQSKEFYCNTIGYGKAISFRSPLVCPSEVNDINITHNDIIDKWFKHFKDQDVVMVNMYDMSLPQQGGADCDGDAVFLCNDPIVINSKIDKPIIIDIEDKALAKTKSYTKENLIEYELATRDNRIGEITCVCTSILNKYTTNEELKSVYDDFVSLLRIYQGKEIDFLKTGTRWHMNKGLRKYMKQLPIFLLYNYPQKLQLYKKIVQKNKKIENNNDKLRLNAYHSPSPMNELCEYINAWEKKNLLWDNTAFDTRCLTLNHKIDISDKAKSRKIKHIINDFAVEWKNGVKEKERLKHMNLEDNINLEALINHYKNKLSDLEQNEEVLANYVINISYNSAMTCKALAWKGYGDYIIKNLKENSDERKRTIIEEVPNYSPDSYEYLGKHYKLMKGIIK